MARTKDSASSPKEPGRLKQMWQVFQMTRRYDSTAQWLMLLGFLAPIAVTLGLALWLSEGNGFTIALWVVAGVLAGLLIAMIILGRRAERAAYSQIDGQPGAVGAVLRSGLRGGWVGNEMPVAVNGRTQDAVYRAVGRGGVVLISEGPASRTQRMLDDEQRKVARVLPTVDVTLISVGHEEGDVELHRLAATLRKLKKTLTKPEVMAVSNRLNSLQSSLPIPKGIDPLKVRPQRGKLR
ncbi:MULTISPECIES: DUF4191 domain-containing protein [Agromyces]|uniref:DUF4191 domain-containing protein n=1 Tax=Agromyces mediolanus TaxID=41986 RepID=A0A918FG11_AGRME|nr:MULTISPECIES: DUF4191 domain-containing protein [Agromyces]MCD1572273.1 DUF4191 domain-containing protein [Agromyces mediolanus]GGR35558.1 hypothetical protein GCM10010196_31890 [Agromyces mediolanus]GLJ73020.1 hypothetical protein GCM10017583_22760 [Agromyces mediolanus]GLU90118.1 hypothetical protein Agsp01_23730 [Agromyces sp. NBRC 114283]